MTASTDDDRERFPTGGLAQQSQTPASHASQTASQWASPPEPIDRLLDAPAFPAVLISPHQQWLVELERPSMPTIADLAEPEVAVAGFRLNPKTNGPARHRPYTQMRMKPITPSENSEAIAAADPTPIALPEPARIGFLRWSPDGQKLAFTLTQETGLELWVLHLEEGKADQLTPPILNAAYGTPYRWLADHALLCKCILGDRGPEPVKPSVPAGPMIEENLGKKTPSRTYTNLLREPHDEALFEYYVTSTLELVTLEGQRTPIGSPGLIDEAKPSPDGNYILLSTLHRPFSYQLPATRFPKQIQVLDRSGEVIHQVADLPLADQISTKFDAVRTGPRWVSWRSDRPATLYWAEALDEGDPTKQVPYRDALYELEAPFSQTPVQLWQSPYRYRGILWGHDECALVWERWYDSRQVRVWRINPAQPEADSQLLLDRSFEDQYSHPGEPLMMPNRYGRSVLRFTADGNQLYLAGRGASPDGVYPFLDQWDLTTGETVRLWQCQDPYFEQVLNLFNGDAQHLITLQQSQTEPPNYYILDCKRTHRRPLTYNSDPAPEFAGIQKSVVRYQRADGVHLSATLYLPAGYDPNRNGPLPTVFWIYPEEFKSRELAGQVTTAENTFSRPRGSSVLFLLTQGYAILRSPSLPIIGEGEAEPNDTYVEQLLAGIEAAVEYVVDRGIADRDHLGIGGHSYGAFTTANVLAHSTLFQAGIAMSGAYNRTLTPFGFQGEQRTFWEAPDTYIRMSPFTHAANITAPLLLMHGGNDGNSGTYPLQTERLYEALKGLGATVRWVVLPLEDHGYRSREAIAHTLWEMVAWYDRYIKR